MYSDARTRLPGGIYRVSGPQMRPTQPQSGAKPDMEKECAGQWRRLLALHGIADRNIPSRRGVSDWDVMSARQAQSPIREAHVVVSQAVTLSCSR